MSGNLLKGLIGDAFGLTLSMVGVAVVGGDVRFTFGQSFLLGGIDIIAALIGLYCIQVPIDMVAWPDRHLEPPPPGRGFRFFEAIGISVANGVNLIRSSLIGTLVGILPRAGARLPRSFPIWRHGAPPGRCSSRSSACSSPALSRA